jgi:hypothetical protein
MIVLDTSVPAEFVEQEQPDDQPIACLTSLDSEAGDTDISVPTAHREAVSFLSFLRYLGACQEGAR